MKRLLRPVDKGSDPDPEKAPRILLSAAGSLMISNILPMNPRSSALMARVPKIVDNAAPSAFVIVASDSPSVALALETRLGVTRALTPSMKLPGGIGIDVS